MHSKPLLCAFLLFLSAGPLLAVEPGPTFVSFARQVKPILQRRCQGCHQPSVAGGKLVLTSYAAFKKGGSSGPCFVPEKPDKSLILKLIVGEPPAMPKNQPPVPPAEVKILTDWIRQGAGDDTVVVQDSIRPDHPPVYRSAPVIAAIAFSPDGSLLAAAGYHEVILHRADGTGIVGRLVGNSRRIDSLAFSPDGHILAAAGGDPGLRGEIQLWDPVQRKLLASIDAGTDTVFGLSFSPDGSRVAVGGADNSVRVYAVPGGKQLIKFDNHSDWVFGTTFAADKKHLLSASRDQAIKLILMDGPTGSFEDDINTHYAPIRCLVGVPGADRVLCGSDDGIVRLYQIFRTTARTMNNEDHNLLRAFSALPMAVIAMAISPDGKRVAAGDQAGNIRVFRVSDGVTLVASKFYNGGVFSLAFASDSQVLALGGFDGRIMLLSGTGQVLRSFVGVPLISPNRRAHTSRMARAHS